MPRQNGKNALIEIRELFGMVILGEKILHTAHEVKTARKAFLRIAGFFENERQYPELAALVKDIRKTNGQEAVTLTNGGSVEFVARSRGSARGFTVDVLICDEAQELNEEQLAALKPTTSAAKGGNPQFILTGTPPDPETEHGQVFKRIRAEAGLKRDKRLAWADYGVADGPLPNIDDREAWLAHNPSAPFLIDVEEIQGEHLVFSPETFARERLGWWGDPDAALATAFGEGRWAACRVDGLEMAVDAVAVSVSWDRSHASIGVAGMAGGKLVVGADKRREGTGWLVPELKRIQDERRCAVVIDNHGPSADLIPALDAAGVHLTITKTSDYYDACVSIFDRVQQEALAHPGHELLDAAVSVANKRDVGDAKQFAWARKKSAGDISMLEAVTLAAWGAARGNNYDLLDSIL